MSIQNVFRVWDTLLLVGSSFSSFIAVSLMIQLRQTLLSLDFNAAILLFSSRCLVSPCAAIQKIHLSPAENSVTEMPNVNLETCVRHALKLHKETPPSIYTKKYVDLVRTDLPCAYDLTYSPECVPMVG